MSKQISDIRDEKVMGEMARAFKPSIVTRLKVLAISLISSLSPTRERGQILSDAIIIEVVVPDVSFYQKIINFFKMKAAGAMGVFIRAGQNLWIDSFWYENWSKAKEAGLPRGSYWLYDSRIDPKKQAQIWASLIQADNGEMEHVVDLEERYRGPFTGWRHWYDFVVEFQRLTKLPDDRIGIYTTYYYWLEFGPNPVTEKASNEWFGRFSLWIAWWAELFSMVKIPKPWNMPRHWQIGTPVLGEKYGVQTKEIDINKAININKEQFVLKYGGEGIPDEEPDPNPPTPEPDPVTELQLYVATALKNRINVRTSPVVSLATDTDARVNIGETFGGRIWAGNGYVWIKVGDANRSNLIGRWLAVRKLDNSEVLIDLDKAVALPEPPEVGVSTIQYARLKHDRQLAMYGYKSRFAKGTFPEPVPFFVAPKANAGKDDIKLSAAWETFLKGINSADGYKHVRVGKAGWFNQNTNADTLSFGGNVVEVEVQGSWTKVRAFNVNDAPPSAKDVNFETSPQLVQKLVAMRPDGSITNPADGKDAFMFIIKRKGDLYVPTDRIELFPSLPVDVTVRSLIRVFSSPIEKSAALGLLLPGTQVRILGYAPRGCSVWGRTSGGWIYLLRNIVPGKFEYFTSWVMATEPPIASKVAG